MCKIDSSLEPAVIAQGAQLSALWQPRWLGWGGGGRQAQEGGDICIHIVDSLHCTVETQHCKTILLQLKKKAY